MYNVKLKLDILKSNANFARVHMLDGSLLKLALELNLANFK